MLPDQGKLLLQIARSTISHVLCVRNHAATEVDETIPWLREPGASFVTLTCNGELRGCIGTLQAHQPLLADIKSNAVSAALHDPRFLPLSQGEVASVQIEVSLLTTPQSLDFIDEADALTQLRPGIDGIVFEYAHCRSTFLPQVWENYTQPQQFLAKLKRKAGLVEDFWAEGIKLSRYTVSKWREADFFEENSNG
jgi:AmmeMemoRadiSam system protein A